MNIDTKKIGNNLTKARVRLQLDHPFWASISGRLEHSISTNVETAATDGKWVKYNPDFLAKLSVPETTFLIAHEAGHVALGHHLRCGDRDPELWNVACDYAVNWVLFQDGFVLPQGALIDPQYKDLSSEAIYERIKGQPNGRKRQSFGQVQTPTKGDGQPLTPAELKEKETELKAAVTSAETAARLAGKLPAELARQLANARKPRIPWTDILRTRVVSLAREDYSYRRPSRRSDGNVILPSLRTERPPKVAVLVDTSGSVSQSDLDQALSEIGEAAAITRLPVVVGAVDTRFHGWSEYEEGGKAPRLSGGGGTDFSDAFDSLLEEEASDIGLVVFITDGATSAWGRCPDQELIWVISPSDESIKPPFGEVLYPN
jgi:predicted metal-dependent peptidase